MDLIRKEEQALTARALNGLSQIPGLKIYGIKDADSPRFSQKLGVIVFELKGMMADKVAKELAGSGHAVWILGSERDFESGQRIVALSGETARNLCGQTRLEDTVDLLSLAGNAVTNDSGLMHIAAAVGCHVVAIYGSSNPDYTPPLTNRRSIQFLGLECSPCMARECPLGPRLCRSL